MTLALLIHGGESTAVKLRAELPGVKVRVVFRKGLSAVYDEHTGLAHDFPTLRELVASVDAEYQPGERLAVLAYSAGGWALRHYLRSPDDRELLSAAVFLDSTYGKGDGSSLPAYEGAIEFGRMAQADPKAHRLVLAYHGAPGPGPASPALYSQIIAREIGASGQGPGVFLRGFEFSHAEMQGRAAPLISHELLSGWLGPAPKPRPAVDPWRGLARAAKSDPQGVEAMLRVADALDYERSELARAVEIESQWTPSAKGVDSRGIEYSGAIQMSPQSLRMVGWSGTPEAFRALSLAEQAPYVLAYLGVSRAAWKRPGSLYLAIAGPKWINVEDSHVIGPKGSRVWNDNKPWRGPNDGDVTVGSIRQLGARIPPDAPVSFEPPARPAPAASGGGSWAWLVLLVALAGSGVRRWLS
jgi:hypothetical protein